MAKTEAAPKADETTNTKPTLPPQLANKQDGGLEKVVITKLGDGKVSTGEHVTGEGDVMAKRGDTLQVSPTIADALEARGFAERP